MSSLNVNTLSLWSRPSSFQGTSWTAPWKTGVTRDKEDSPRVLEICIVWNRFEAKSMRKGDAKDMFKLCLWPKISNLVLLTSGSQWEWRKGLCASTNSNLNFNFIFYIRICQLIMVSNHVSLSHDQLCQATHDAVQQKHLQKNIPEDQTCWPSTATHKEWNNSQK